ncbi:DNA-directed RNA polymerase, omega subunit [Thermanaerovibrio acidaminovorans DSM 6589]|uniref:DNA-directed RNA polymerase subunit omega n=1 Tax=Thermanaerovibrio acidaminovorans (strain ATCC 49978 / DSM 6589 / Su883) TaxID=525903 RepID=D1B9R6_THEAS|nr:DNA-directed RNA polymerase subunit omega [Thermanaerovibrio acidaminovorans]ACZ19019.1 DNA-directed RNA polymerase, omega subunit [Thermanaerovibrio acidaminovorans DSM 6589]
MIFCDIDRICRERNIPNKYVLALVVAARARQLSERKGRLEDEKYISRAIDEISRGDVLVSCPMDAHSAPRRE